MSATTLQTSMIEAHEYGNGKNNVPDEKSHEGVRHIKVAFIGIKNASNLAGNSAAI